jgi:hypothetical protein
LEAFAVVSSASYFLGVLDLAARNYGDLKGKTSIRHTNMDGKMTEEILERYGDPGFAHRTTGHSGGRTGSFLEQDIASGAWCRQFYELRNQEKAANFNWFPIEVFVSRIRQVDAQGKIRR